jgi:pyridoxamine 5'-phosphate oxidase
MSIDTTGQDTTGQDTTGQDTTGQDTTGKNWRTEGAAPDFTNAADPFALFEQWLADATAREINDPNAMALATVDTQQMPNVRMVLLKGLDAADVGAARGFVFYTNAESAKGRELEATSHAALLFHWKTLRRQVRVRGKVSRVTTAEADAYFATRARGSQVGAWASQQSRPLETRATLEQAVAAVAAQYGDQVIPRPPHWPGFRVTPLEIEFWHDRPYRLHERLVFRRSRADAPWDRAGLFP